MVTSTQPVETTRPDQTSQPREVWQLPWSWAEAFLVQGGVIFVAFCVQYVLSMRQHALTIPYPMSWLLPTLMVLGAMTVSFIGRRDAFVRWLSSVQFAVAGITIYTVLGLVGILVAQERGTDPLSQWGFRSLFTSIPFLTASLLIMLNLAMVVGRRLASPARGFFGFMLNHIGLLLVMIGLIAGSAQLLKPPFALFLEQKVSSIQDEEKHATYKLGGSIVLHRFNIDYYSPRPSLLAVDMQAMMKGGENFHIPDTALATPGHIFQAYGMTITVEEYLPSAMATGDGSWSATPPEKEASTKPEADPHGSMHLHQGVPAVKVSYATADGKMSSGWIAEGMGNSLKIGKEYVLMMMADRTPKRYQSFVTITEDGKKPVETVIEVNKPARIGPWRLYQMDYDKDNPVPMYSVLQAVKDPALPVVYTGLVCMVLGAFLALWAPRRRPATSGEEAA
jgi:hypothetical protein